MRASERAIIFGVVLAALTIGFYVMVLGPKRDKASELSKQIDQLHASISHEQQVADFAEQARRQFPRYYGRLVVLGKAVPAQADTASMLVQLNSISHRSKVAFRGISLSQGSESAGTGTSSSSSTTTTPPSGSTSTTPTTPSAPASTGTSTSGAAPSTATSGTSGSTAPVSATPAPATEASAAALPIGAVVGPGGLPTLPYDLSYRGTFFDISNFLGGLDGLVTPNGGGTQVSSNGRLFTVNGFALNGGAPGSSPKLDANFLVTTYVTPEEQGLTAGATPSGPAVPTAPGAPQAQPASAVVSK
jgi:Tfp pilus assembly protein PilO